MNDDDLCKNYDISEEETLYIAKSVKWKLNEEEQEVWREEWGLQQREEELNVEEVLNAEVLMKNQNSRKKNCKLNNNN